MYEKLCKEKDEWPGFYHELECGILWHIYRITCLI
jgi:hypothetical protein